MKCYIVAVITARSCSWGISQDVNNLVLIINDDPSKRTGYRKVITPDHTLFNFIIQSVKAESHDLKWTTQSLYELHNPIAIGECEIGFCPVPKVICSTCEKDMLEYNNIITFKDKRFRQSKKTLSSYKRYSLELYSLNLGGNFLHGTFEFNFDVIKRSVLQILIVVLEKTSKYVNAPLTEQCKYKPELLRDEEEDHTYLVFPEIESRIPIKCEKADDFKWGLSIVESGGCKGIMDIAGRFLLPCKYDDILPLRLFEMDDYLMGKEVSQIYKDGNFHIHTFVKDEEEKWAFIDISTDDSKWILETTPEFKYSEIYPIKGKDYVVGFINQEYAESVDNRDIDWDDDQEFGLLNRLSIIFYDGSTNTVENLVDEVYRIVDDKYVIVGKYIDDELLMGVYEIEEMNNCIRAELSIKLPLEYTDIEYIGNHILMVWSDMFSSWRSQEAKNMVQQYIEENQGRMDLSTLICDYVNMNVFHLTNGWINPPGFTPTTQFIEKRNGKYYTVFGTGEYYRHEDRIEKEETEEYYYYDEDLHQWEPY